MQLIFLIVPYVLIFVWLVISIRLLRQASWNFNNVNQYYIDSISPVFTTLGVLGTFIGIAVGLFHFDVNNIDSSLPQLLDGLKLAFLTSIFGISFSLTFTRIIDYLKFKSENGESYSTEEITALNKIIEILIDVQKSISSDRENSLSTELNKLRLMLRDQAGEVKGHAQLIDKRLQDISQLLGSNNETSIVTQLQKMRNEQFEIAMENKNFAAKINENLTNSRELIARKFEEFTTLLQKSNTEALVKAIENVIGGFNERLNQLLERLVKENFEELNNSVKLLNEWQKENKEQVRVLVLQFKYIYERLQGTSETLKQITATTDQLTGNSSLLKKLVEELQQVMVEDQIFKESVQKLQQSSTELHSSSEKLDSWIKRETTFATSVDNLISSLKEIEQLRDSSGQFWNDIKSKLNENSDVLAEGNQKLMNQVNNLEKSFQERMNTSFRSLDKILQAMVTEYAKKMNTNYQAS